MKQKPEVKNPVALALEVLKWTKLISHFPRLMNTSNIVTPTQLLNVGRTKLWIGM
jgi:hypothetical protein